MTTFIRCPECGFCIGKYIDFIDEAKQALYDEMIFNNKKYKDYNVEKIAFANNITPSLEPLFDALDIHNRCCRMHIIAKTSFNSIYR